MYFYTCRILVTNPTQHHLSVYVALYRLFYNSITNTNPFAEIIRFVFGFSWRATENSVIAVNYGVFFFILCPVNHAK